MAGRDRAIGKWLLSLSLVRSCGNCPGEWGCLGADCSLTTWEDNLLGRQWQEAEVEGSRDTELLSGDLWLNVASKAHINMPYFQPELSP